MNRDSNQADVSAGESSEPITLCMCGSSYTQRTCEHDFKGWREFTDGNGGEAICIKCGLGAMAHSLSLDW